MRQDKLELLILKILTEKFEPQIETICRNYLTQYKSVRHIISHMESSLKWTVPSEIQKKINSEDFVDDIIDRIKRKQL